MIWSRGRRLEILQIGDPLLRSVARPLAPTEIASTDVQRLIADMRTTMRNAPGVGLAAPQVGHGLRLFVVEDTPAYQSKLSATRLAALERSPVAFQAIINPTLQIDDPTEVEHFEGCLSVADLRGLVKRARAVTVRGLDAQGQTIEVRAVGWHARILQHELDHLEGRLCIDRMAPATICTLDNYVRYWSECTPSEARQRMDSGLGESG